MTADAGGEAWESIASLRSMSALMLLIDGRFPAGGHAHSGGFEAAAANEKVTDIASMEQFLLGRLHTTGLVAAAFAGSSCLSFGRAARMSDEIGHAAFSESLAALDAEFDARTPSPVLRVVSRRLGRQLVRAGRRIWPHPLVEELARLPGQGVHQPIAFGVVAGAAGQPPVLAATAAAQESITGPATASVRLLGLDPFEVNALLARLADDVATVGAGGFAAASSSPADLPASAGYLIDISAEVHATWEVRLFAS
ncbi:urease accessory protein UreF [Arthrobacter echini]|uniref:Urease accessory protein UreF n=2 Tax=Arthrobacter echini TaxID=1529066 RepID=A0A4V3Z578_9MICC|nr:urease accessory protein UreF [Arthrobacter echini]